MAAEIAQGLPAGAAARFGAVALLVGLNRHRLCRRFEAGDNVHLFISEELKTPISTILHVTSMIYRIIRPVYFELRPD